MYFIRFSGSYTFAHNKLVSNETSSALSSFAKDEGTRAKKWLNHLIFLDDMRQSTIKSKLKRSLFPTESEKLTILNGLYKVCAKVSK